MTNDPTKRQQLDELKRQVAALEAEIEPTPSKTWSRSETGFYSTYAAWSGAILGMFAAVASLLVNVIGSLIVGQNPLRLIQVYLTFPLGEKALAENLDTGIVMAIGCCLYILTGMVLAIPIYMLMAKFVPKGSLAQRLAFATVVGLLLWAVNFYLILSWLQPLLFGGNWITNAEYLPPWIGAFTHLVFAWTLALLYPWGTMAMNESTATTNATPA